MKSSFLRLTAAAFVVATVGACSAGATASSAPTPTAVAGSSEVPSTAAPPPSGAPVGGIVVPLRTANAVAQACMDALLGGKLVASNLSGIAVAGSDGNVTEVEWPFGYSARLVEGKVVLLDENGKIVAKVGDEITVGGGFGNQFWYACGPVNVTKPGT